MNGTGNPTSREHDWERWRGEVTTTLAGLASQMSTVVAFVEEQKSRNAAADAVFETHRGTRAWIAPNFPALISGLIALVALAVMLFGAR